MTPTDFKPIDNNAKLHQAIKYIDRNCTKTIKKVIGKELPIAGNIAVFTHTADEYKILESIAKNIVEPTVHLNQKYLRLKKPIFIANNKYEWLYIRKPHKDSPQIGDIDFILSDEDYNNFKNEVVKGNYNYTRIYNRPNWDMIEIVDPRSNVLPYISTLAMAERVRLKD